MSGTYAKRTTVPEQKSREELERILKRYGADQFLYAWEMDRAVIRFRMNKRQISFLLPLPLLDEFTDSYVSYGRAQQAAAEKRQAERHEQALRQRWRALVLIVKAKLEAVESGVTTFEDEFLAHTLLPDGQTIGEWARPQIESAYLSGAMPQALLPAGRS